MNMTHLRGNLDKIGVIHGRFQGLHLGHMEYLIEGMKRCEFLYIGITNYEPSQNLKKINLANRERTSKNSNPFSFYQRFEMIRGSLFEENHNYNDKYAIIPFPIETPSSIFNFSPKDATYYITIYDSWGHEKKRILEKLGCKVNVMWTRDYSQRFTSGTELRERIRLGREWKELVPKYVYDYITNNKLDKLLRK